MLLSLALALSPSDGFSVLLGPEFGPGSVYHVDSGSATLAAPELVDIDLRDLDYAQRTRYHSLDPRATSAATSMTKQTATGFSVSC